MVPRWASKQDIRRKSFLSLALFLLGPSAEIPKRNLAPDNCCVQAINIDTAAKQPTSYITTHYYFTPPATVELVSRLHPTSD